MIEYLEAVVAFKLYSPSFRIDIITLGTAIKTLANADPNCHTPEVEAGE